MNNQTLKSVLFAISFKSPMFNRENVKNIFERHNLDSKMLPKISSKTDAKKAIRDYYSEHKSSGSLLNPVTESNNTVTFQINKCDLESTQIVDSKTGEVIESVKKKFDTDEAITLVYDCDSDHIINDDIVIVERVESLLGIRRSTYTKQVIKDTLLNHLIKDCNAFKMKSDSDILMVPGNQISEVDRIKHVVKELDSLASFTYWEIGDSPSNKQSITDTIVARYEDFNNGYKAKIEKFCAESHKMSKGEINAFIREVESNYKILESYKDVLENQFDTCMKNLKATKAFVNQYYQTGRTDNPYQKDIDYAIETMKKNNKSNQEIAEIVDTMINANEDYATCEIPDDIKELMEM